MKDSFSTDYRSWTRQATTSLKDDSESVEFYEYDGVRIYIYKHAQQLFIIWFVCINVQAVNWMNHTNQTTDHQPEMLQLCLNIILNQ